MSHQLACRSGTAEHRRILASFASILIKKRSLHICTDIYHSARLDIAFPEGSRLKQVRARAIACRISLPPPISGLSGEVIATPHSQVSISAKSKSGSGSASESGTFEAASIGMSSFSQCCLTSAHDSNCSPVGLMYTFSTCTFDSWKSSAGWSWLCTHNAHQSTKWCWQGCYSQACANALAVTNCCAQASFHMPQADADESQLLQQVILPRHR